MPRPPVRDDPPAATTRRWRCRLLHPPEGKNQVALRLVTLAMQAQERRDHGGVAVLHVLGCRARSRSRLSRPARRGRSSNRTRSASTTSIWHRNRIGFSEGVPAARIRTTRFCLRGSGPRSSISCGAKPPSSSRFRIASVPVLTLPRGVSVVLISISSFSISRPSARSSAEAAGIGAWASRIRDTERKNSRTMTVGKYLRSMCHCTSVACAVDARSCTNSTRQSRLRVDRKPRSGTQHCQQSRRKERRLPSKMSCNQRCQRSRDRRANLATHIHGA